MYDREAFVAVFGEVKLPNVALEDLAASTEREDQIGRYLAQTGVVLLFNLRAVGLLACRPGYQRKLGVSVQPADRDLLDTVELWPSDAAFRKGGAIAAPQVDALADLLERAVTEFAPIADPSSLARILARLARRARADLPEKFDAVAGLLEDYRAALGLTFTDADGAEFFRSSLIQTAFYALFAGWTLWHRANDGTPFAWERVDGYLKIPFLAKLFYEFRHPDRLAELGLAPHLDRATAALGRVDRGAFFGQFTYGASGEAIDEQPEASKAITYFYEPFLEAFDPDLRKELGVWYTPPEIVKYQVRKIDRLLREELGCPRGFADDRVVVLDPCCGTGAYLLDVVQCIAEELLTSGDEAILAAELLQAVSNRIIGFEILTAPFVIAQLQMYLLLTDMGLPPPATTRPAIFLTNALTGWEGTDQIKLNFPELQQEHDAARQVKRDARIIVILGNPPYNRFAGTALAEEADLVDHYKGVVREAKRDRKSQAIMGPDGAPVMVQKGESLLYSKWGIRKQLLDDLYIRFFRLAEKRIGEAAEYGVVSFISHSSYLTGRSHPIMRESLLSSFNRIWIDNLNGDKYKTGKIVPAGLPRAGTADQSAFTTEQDARGIQVGTAVATLLKHRSDVGGASIVATRYRDFWGKAKDKRHALLVSADMDEWETPRRQEAEMQPAGPRGYEVITPSAANRWMLCPRDENAGFEAWPALDELFQTAYQGVNPNRGIDGSLIDTVRDALAARMAGYFSDLDHQQFRDAHPVLMTSRARYEPEAVRDRLRLVSRFQPEQIVPYRLFPLDARWVYYETQGKLLNERRPEFWDNLEGNEFLVAVPQPRQVSETRPLIASTLVDLHLHDRGSVCFPLVSKNGLLGTAANISPRALTVLRSVFKLTDKDEVVERELVAQLFRCAMALMHSPQYESDHAEALSQDWAHVPIPQNCQIFESLVETGNQIAILLDPTRNADSVVRAVLTSGVTKTIGVLRKVGGGAAKPDDLRVDIAYHGAAKGKWTPRAPTEPETLRPEWGETTADLFINNAVFFSNVPERVWTYQLGGYPVLKKWLGYRQADRRAGRPLDLAEARHFRSMVQRLAALLALGNTLDSLYEQAAASAFTAEELDVRGV